MEKPLLSVIVPVYKVEKFLPRCLRSLVSQTYENLEILLVDDGSPDGSGAICDAWAEKDRRIRVIHQKNAGAGAARNAALDAAGGQQWEKDGEGNTRSEEHTFELQSRE